ncbi:hypothetical protein BGZ94_001970, partial [Podila epigama]
MKAPTTFASSLSCLLIYAAAITAAVIPTKTDTTTTMALPSGQTAALISESEYCLFLPRTPGQTISESEDSAVAFCNKPSIPSAPNARLLPQGFVKSLHFHKNTTKEYVQITGRIDRSKYNLPANDGGGQYDIKAPVGSKCAGYNYYVELVEPDIQIYCLRCCKNKVDCPVNKSTYGC